jgi:hypothetical protein
LTSVPGALETKRVDPAPDPGNSAAVRPFMIVEMLILCCAAVFVLLGTFSRSNGDAANSRLATVLSLTEDGTWYIDRPLDREPNRFEQGTIDKVMVTVDGQPRMLSSKPPMMPLIMTAEYVVMNKLFGLDLNDEEDTQQIIRWMSIFTIGIPYLLTLIFFLKILELYMPDSLTRLILLFSLAFCTQLWGYSTNINNHVPGACCTVIALYFALSLVTGRRSAKAWRFFAFGLAGGLVPTLDMPATVFVFLAGLFLLQKFPGKTLLWTSLGAAVPLGIHFAIMIATTGAPVPVQTRDELYKYRGAYWRHPIQVDALAEPKGEYLFNMTFGRSGVFALYPVLMLGVAAALRALVRRDMPYRRELLTAAAGFVVMSLYYVLKTNNYGGEAYGFRWFIAAMPVLLLMGAPIVRKLRARWEWIFIGLMIGISFYSAWECTGTPWAANQEWTKRFLGPTYR